MKSFASFLLFALVSLSLARRSDAQLYPIGGLHVFSGGSLPVITAVSPNLGSAGGGWVFKTTFSSPPASVSAVTVNGNPATSCSYVSPVETCTAPAYSTANGSSTGQTIAVTTSGGTVSSSGNQQNYFYLPSNNSFALAHRGDALVTVATGVSNLGDISGNGNDWQQATGSAQPAVLASFNSTGLAGLTLNGTSSYMEVSLSADITDGTSLTSYLVAAYTSISGSTYEYSFQGSTITYYQVHSSTNQIADSGHRIGTVASDTSAHVFSALLSGASSWVQTDATRDTGTMAANAPISSAIWLGSYPGGSPTAALQFACDIIYKGALSNGDDTTVRGILKAIYGTP